VPPPDRKQVGDGLSDEQAGTSLREVRQRGTGSVIAPSDGKSTLRRMLRRWSGPAGRDGTGQPTQPRHGSPESGPWSASDVWSARTPIARFLAGAPITPYTGSVSQ
jgi:hypothetical protein